MLFFTFTLLLIEFLDELVYGAQGAALPVIRTDLNLSYAQIGLLLSVPHLIGNAIEPALFILADVWKRKLLIVGGGLVFALGLLLIAFGQTFLTLLIAFTILFPASGAFVSLSQATLMDLNPTRHEQLMVRWTLFGSLGVVSGSLALAAALALMWGWRGLYVAFALLTLALVVSVWKQTSPHPLVAPLPDGEASKGEGGIMGLRAGVLAALRAFRNPHILRWLILLDLADLMGDILLSFTALYFVDVVHVTEAEAALAVTVLTSAGLLGNAFIIPLLERVRGLSYLRWSALSLLVLYAAMLVVPAVAIKYFLLACIGLGAAGWYAVLRGQLYSAMPGQSGISLAVSSIAGIAGGLIPGALGFIAGAFGLPWTMAVLAIGPLSLLVGLPRKGMKGVKLDTDLTP